jgi:lysophospholipase L1-like esterase
MHYMQQLAFIGDSLTQWFGWDRRFPTYRVINRGISGERVEELLARMPDIYTEIGNPDYIFLMTGINNIGEGHYGFMDNYREIIRNFNTRYKKAKVVVQSILPTALDWIDNNRIQDFNRRLEEVAREFNAAYLDVYRLFVDSNGNPDTACLQDDGVHVSSKGYEVWANEVERFLKRGEAA